MQESIKSLEDQNQKWERICGVAMIPFSSGAIMRRSPPSLLKLRKEIMFSLLISFLFLVNPLARQANFND